MLFIRLLIVVANLELLAVMMLAIGGWPGLFFWLCNTALAALFTRAIRMASERHGRQRATQYKARYGPTDSEAASADIPHSRAIGR
jgi:hypothetical protein